MVTRDDIIASVGELSVTPRVIRRLSVLLKELNPELEQVVTALKMEPVLTTAIIVAANAPSHFRGVKLTSVAQAVERIGLRETYRIALLVTFRQGLRIPNLPDTSAADSLWSRAIIAGCAMEELAVGEDTAAAFTVGVLHLIGCFVIARAGAGLATFDNMSAASLARAQQASIGLAYPEAGAIALEAWGFPPEVTEPVRFQLTPASAGSHHRIAAYLSTAAELGLFIEESRTDSPLYRNPPRHPMAVDAFVLRVEERSVELMESFYSVPRLRPRWTAPAGSPH